MKSALLNLHTKEIQTNNKYCYWEIAMERMATQMEKMMVWQQKFHTQMFSIQGNTQEASSTQPMFQPQRSPSQTNWPSSLQSNQNSYSPAQRNVTFVLHGNFFD